MNLGALKRGPPGLDNVAAGLEPPQRKAGGDPVEAPVANPAANNDEDEEPQRLPPPIDSKVDQS